MASNISLIRESERAHYIMQLSSYFSELTDRPGVRYAYTHRLQDIWYNQAYDITWEKDDIDELVLDVEKFLKEHDRLPCFYLTPATEPNNLGKLLEEKGYGKFEDEAWMFFDFNVYNEIKDKLNNITISEISVNNLDVFSDIYRKGLPGPEVEKYIDAVVDGFCYKPPLVDIWYYIAYYSNEPAGMISLLKVGKYAGVYAVATIEKYQKKGIATALNSHVVKIAKQVGAEHIFLQTVVGEESEEIFGKMGYKTIYVREGYTTKEAISDLEHG